MKEGRKKRSATVSLQIKRVGREPITVDEKKWPIWRKRFLTWFGIGSPAFKPLIGEASQTANKTAAAARRE
jgi:hypothetical protein